MQIKQFLSTANNFLRANVHLILIVVTVAIAVDFGTSIKLQNLLNHRKIIADEQRSSLNKSVVDVMSGVSEVNQKLTFVIDTEIKQMKKEIADNRSDINALKAVIANKANAHTFIVHGAPDVEITK